MSKLVITSDTSGWYESDDPLTPWAVAAIRNEFAGMPWPPIGLKAVFGSPVVIEDRRPAQPTVRRVNIEVGRRSPEGSDNE